MTLLPLLDTHIYSVLFTGLLTNMFVPVRLCPGSSPTDMVLSVWSVPLTLHDATPSVAIHVSSIGSGV